MPVGVISLGMVTAAGLGVEALTQALADAQFSPPTGLPRADAPSLPVALCHNFEPKGVLPPLVTRRLDRASRLLAVASRQALQAAGQLPWPPEDIGVAMGTWTAGTSALVEILQAVFTWGPDQAPPMHFPNSVANAPASQVGILEALRGANLTFYEKQAGGLRAIVEGFRLVKEGKLQAVLAGGVDEGQWLNAEAFARLRALREPGRPGFTLGEGAVALLLAPTLPGTGERVVVLGAGAAGLPCPPHLYPESPAGLLAAGRKALAEAQVQPSDVDLLVSLANGSPSLAHLEAAAMLELFGNHRPQVLAGIPERLGEGAFSSALRVAAAIPVLLGHVKPAWPVPEHLASKGFPPVLAQARTALVTALAGGGSAVAAVFQRQEVS